MPRKAKAIGAEGIGLDDLGSRVNVITVDGADGLGLRQIEFVVAAIDKDALLVQQRSHGSVAEHRRTAQAIKESGRHLQIVPAVSGRAERPGAFVCYNLSSNPPPATSLHTGVPLKKTGILFVLIATAGWVSCGGGGSSQPRLNLTFLAKRAFITNSSSTNGSAVVSIIDAVKDLFGNHAITVAPGTNVIATTIPGKVSVV